MAIAQVLIYQTRPGRMEENLGLAKRADKILRALGATTRTLTSVAGGPTPNALIYVIETPDWKAHGELSAKLETDQAFIKFRADVDSTNNPPGDLVSSALYAEIPLG